MFYRGKSRPCIRLVSKSGLRVSVCHFPRGTSKWNKIEHRLSSFISSNWRGEPLRDYETIVHLIARTTTTKGLKVMCRLDRRKYSTGRKVSAAEMKQIKLRQNKFYAGWNYSIAPRIQTSRVYLYPAPKRHAPAESMNAQFPRASYFSSPAVQAEQTGSSPTSTLHK